MIEVTQEMIEAFGEAWERADYAQKAVTAPKRPGNRRRAGIRAVLDIVERDYINAETDESDLAAADRFWERHAGEGEALL
jgi:hypothetical protein